MSGLFISYRHKGTMGWAGRLCDDFRRRFDASQVFMDIMGLDGGIRPGRNFEQELTNALSKCDVLVALIDPEWTSCKDPDGCRRLDDPKDWVRNEIASAFQRKIFVVPVLLGKAKSPDEKELPEEIKLLCKQQSVELSDHRWNYDVEELVKCIRSLAPQLILKKEDDIAYTNTGLRLLLELSKTKAVADVISRSKEVFDNAYRQTVKLELFKTIHDALHKIEFGCVRVIEECKATSPLRPMKITFATEARLIQKAIQSEHMYPFLREDIVEQLESTDAAFREAVDTPGNVDSYEYLKSSLRTLLSGLPPRLNDGIIKAAADLNLARLVDLLKVVQEKASTVSPEEDQKIDRFFQGIDALERLGGELAQRVEEHTQLQRLDSKLRTVCNGKLPPGQLGSEWGRIKKVRSNLRPPFFPELEESNDDLLALEADVDAAAARGDEQALLNSLRAYFQGVGPVFAAEDTSLKLFCNRLSEVSQPLQAILAEC